MRSRKGYLVILVVIILIAAILLFCNNQTREEKKLVKAMFPNASQMTRIKGIEENTYIAENFPAVKGAYEVDGKPAAFFTQTIGYKGKITVLTGIDNKSGNIKQIRIINHEDTPEYADPIQESWFTDRFQQMKLDLYLKLAVLEKEREEDIIQVTGATVTSQGVLNGVNAAIGAWQYLSHGKEMSQVAVTVPQEMWDKDENSFAINWPGGSVRLTVEDLKKYDMVTVDAVLQKTTGTKINEKVEGPLLSEVLKGQGVNLEDYEGIGITGRDGYYTMIDKEKLKGQAILGIRFNDKEIKADEKPVRFVMPDQMGPYWVKMVSSVDLYDEIAPKDILAVHMFDALTKEIEPYDYEYYGSKDKSIEVGKILSKFSNVNPKGFFTMTSVDGLEKNETLSLVRERYYIKVEGENAPMNIAPKFKLGMNVKNISHFSTTSDCVIFPEKIKEVCRTKDITGKEAIVLEDVLITSGMTWEPSQMFVTIDTDGNEASLSVEELGESYLIYDNHKVALWKNGKEEMTDLLTVKKR